MSIDNSIPEIDAITHIRASLIKILSRDYTSNGNDFNLTSSITDKSDGSFKT